MRHSFSSASEVAHIWAQQNPEQGYAKCKNASYNGTDFFSYSMKIAKFFGENVVVISETTYSNTTSSHCHDAMRAVSHKTILKTPWTIMSTLQGNLNECMRTVNDLKNKSSIKDYRTQLYWIEKAKKYLEVDPTLVMGEYKLCLTEEEVAKKEAAAKKAAQTREGAGDLEPQLYARMREIIAERAANAGIILTPEDAWRNKGKAAVVGLYDDEKISFKHEGKRYTRTVPDSYWLPEDIKQAITRRPREGKLSHICLRKAGDQVETSLGAKASVREAKLLYDMWRTGRDILGFRIGHYTVVGKDADKITIGCHVLPTHEIELFARTMGWEVVHTQTIEA